MFDNYKFETGPSPLMPIFSGETTPGWDRVDYEIVIFLGSLIYIPPQQHITYSRSHLVVLKCNI